MDPQKIRRGAVPGIPFALSLCLSLFTVGKHPYWQDSGIYLTAIKDLGVLYPPGFALYEVLCFAWTRVFFFLDFTLAVHLFSSLNAALAAATIAAAARDLLRSRGRIFRVMEEDPGDLAVQGTPGLRRVHHRFLRGQDRAAGAVRIAWKRRRSVPGRQ